LWKCRRDVERTAPVLLLDPIRVEGGEEDLGEMSQSETLHPLPASGFRGLFLVETLNFDPSSGFEFSFLLLDPNEFFDD
jgi:hypothetical protein